jgi:hypothetical protein
VASTLEIIEKPFKVLWTMENTVFRLWVRFVGINTLLTSLGITFRDLIFVEEGNQESSDKNAINVTKRSILAKTIQQLEGIRAGSESWYFSQLSKPDPIVRAHIKATWLELMEEEDRYKLSCRLEPSKNTAPSTPVTPK